MTGIRNVFSKQMHKVEDSFINEIKAIEPHLTGVVLGLSGGVDSVVLLYLLKRFGINFIAVHVNYGLRGVESDEDENLVRSLCKTKDIPLEVFYFEKSIDVSKGESLQMAARRFRYERFDEIRRKYAMSHIALAHHMDDFLESMLINMTRGTGLAGLAMREKEPFIRPLKNLWKRDIVEYAEMHQFKWREDSSNRQGKYERNKVRWQVLPALKALHPRAESGLEKSVKNFNLAYKYLQHQAAEYLINHKYPYKSGFKISLKSFLPWKEEYSALLWEIFNQVDISSISVDDFVKGFVSDESKIWKLGWPLVFSKSAELYIFPNEHRDGTTSFFQVWEDLNFPCIIKDWGQVRIEKSSDSVWFSDSIMRKKITFRTWKSSDKIQLAGFSKRVPDLIKDCKVDVVSKKYILVMTVEEEVVWVVGFRQSEKFRAVEGDGIPMKAVSIWI